MLAINAQSAVARRFGDTATTSLSGDYHPTTVTTMKRTEHRELHNTTPSDPAATTRIEELRARARAATLSYGDIHELQNDLVAHIDPDDTEMLPWADVDETDG